MSIKFNEEKAIISGFFLTILVFIIFGIGFFWAVNKFSSKNLVVKASYKIEEEKIQEIEKRLEKLERTK